MKRIRTLGLALVATLAMSSLVGASSASATGFEAEEYPAYIEGDQVGTGHLIVLGGDIHCELPSFDLVVEEPTETLTTSGQGDGTCYPEATPKPLELNGCEFRFEPGGEEGEGVFDGAVSIGPSGCGPIVLDIPYFGSCSEVSFDPHSGFETESEYLNQGEHIEVSLAISGLAWKSSPPCEYTGGAILELQWQISARNEGGEPNNLDVSNEVSSQPVTVLCDSSESECAFGNQYGAGTTVQGNSENAVIDFVLNGTPTQTNCASSTLEGTTDAIAGSPLPLDISAWSLENCIATESEFSCTATPVGLPYAGSLAWTEGSDGLLSIMNAGGNPGWRTVCAETGTDCTLRFEPSLALEGGNPANLVASEIPMTKTANKANGCLGIGSPKFSATYSIDQPQPLYVSRD